MNASGADILPTIEKESAEANSLKSELAVQNETDSPAGELEALELAPGGGRETRTVSITRIKVEVDIRYSMVRFI